MVGIKKKKSISRWYNILIEDRQQPAYGAETEVKARSMKGALVEALKSTQQLTRKHAEDLATKFKRTKKKGEYLSRDIRVVITKQ